MLGSKRQKCWSLIAVLVILGSPWASAQMYTVSHPFTGKYNAELKEVLKAGGSLELFETGCVNDSYENWSTSVLKATGTPPKHYTPEEIHKKLEKNEDEEVSEACLAFDAWSGMYSAYSAVDRDTKTAWSEGVPGEGIGEILVVKVDLSEDVEIWSGFGASDKLFLANNRPRKIRAYLMITDSKPTFQQSGIGYTSIHTLKTVEVELKDLNGYQPLRIPHINEDAPTLTDGGTNRTTWTPTTFLAIEILSVYKGNKYDDTCIAEVRNVKK